MEMSDLHHMRTGMTREYMMRVVDHSLQREEKELSRHFPSNRLEEMRNSPFPTLPTSDMIINDVMTVPFSLSYIPEQGRFEEDIENLTQRIGQSDGQTQRINAWKQRIRALKMLRNRVGRIRLIYSLRYLVNDIEGVINSFKSGGQPTRRYSQLNGQQLRLLVDIRRKITGIMFDWARNLTLIPLQDPKSHDVLLELEPEGMDVEVDTRSEADKTIDENIIYTIRKLKEKGIGRGLNEQQLTEMAKKMIGKVKSERDEFGEIRPKKVVRTRDKETTFVDEKTWQTAMNKLMTPLKEIQSSNKNLTIIPNAQQAVLQALGVQTKEVRKKIIPTVANYQQLRQESEDRSIEFGTDLSETLPNARPGEEESKEEMYEMYIFRTEELDRLNNLEDQVLIARQLQHLINLLRNIHKSLRENKPNQTINTLMKEGLITQPLTMAQINTLEIYIQNLMITAYQWAANANLLGGYSEPGPAKDIVTIKKEKIVLPTPPPSPVRQPKFKTEPRSEMRKTIESIVHFGPHSPLSSPRMTPPGAFTGILPSVQSIVVGLTRGQTIDTFRIPTHDNFFDVVLDDKLVSFLGTLEGRIALTRDMLQLLNSLEQLKRELDSGNTEGLIRYKVASNPRLISGLESFIREFETIIYHWAKSIESLPDYKPAVNRR